MNVFIYASRKGSKEAEDIRAALSTVSDGSLDNFETVEEFADRFRRPRDPLSVAVIIDPSHKDLQALVDLRELTLGTRILLILADQKKETMALAHKVFPSYIGYKDGDPSRIVSVVRQLAKAQGEDDPSGERTS